MIRATIGILAGSAGGFDADYQAVLDYATTQGYTLPSASQQLLQEQLVKDLKAAGVWSKLDTFYVFATNGDSDFASINWKNPNSFECDEVNSPTFTTNQGFSGNGTSSYLDTNYNPFQNSVNYQVYDASIGLYVYNSIDQETVGYIGSSANIILRNSSSTNPSKLQRINESTSFTTGLAFGGTGLFTINRTSETQKYAYNGTTEYSQSTSGGSLDDFNIGILQRELALFSRSTFSIFHMGSNIRVEQNDYYTAINLYMSSI